MRKIRRWQLIWSMLVVIGVVVLFVPTLVARDEDRWPYFLLWTQFVLVPGIVVCVVGMFLGSAVENAVKDFMRSRLAGWRARWLLISMAWVAVVSIYLFAAPVGENPIYFFARALAMPVALTIVLLPPILLHWAIKRFIREA